MLETIESIFSTIAYCFFATLRFNYNFWANFCGICGSSIQFLADRLESVELLAVRIIELITRLLNVLPQLISVPYEFLHYDSRPTLHNVLNSEIQISDNIHRKDVTPGSLLYPVVVLMLVLTILILICYYKHKVYMLKLRNSTLEKNQIVYMCCICRYDTSNVLLLPCKHLCVCLRCFYMLKKNEINRTNSTAENNDQNTPKNCCPMCRTDVTDHIRIFA